MQHVERAGQVRLLDLSQCPADRLPNVLVLSNFPWYVSEAAVARYLTEVMPQSTPPPVTTRLYTDPANGVSRGHCFVEYGQVHHNNNNNGSGHGKSHGRSSGKSSPAISGNTHSNNNTTTHSGTAALNSTESEVNLAEVKSRVESRPYEGIAITATLYYLTSSKWDRNGQLPDLPHDPPAPPRRGLTTSSSTTTATSTQVSNSSKQEGHSAMAMTGVYGYGDAGYVVRCGRTLVLPNTVTEEGMRQLASLRKRLRAEE